MYVKNWQHARTMSVKSTDLVDLVQGEDILRSITACRPVNYVSFRNQIIPKHYVARYLPELQWLERLFCPRARRTWLLEMDCHNRLLKRGVRMGLGPAWLVARLHCATLDHFMLALHSSDLIKVLNSLHRFARRVLSKIERKPTALLWGISGAIVITRHSWHTFCLHADKLASRLLGLLDMRVAEYDCNGHQCAPGRDDCSALRKSARSLLELLETST